MYACMYACMSLHVCMRVSTHVMISTTNCACLPMCHLPLYVCPVIFVVGVVMYIDKVTATNLFPNGRKWNTGINHLIAYHKILNLKPFPVPGCICIWKVEWPGFECPSKSSSLPQKGYFQLQVRRYISSLYQVKYDVRQIFYQEKYIAKIKGKTGRFKENGLNLCKSG